MNAIVRFTSGDDSVVATADGIVALRDEMLEMQRQVAAMVRTHDQVCDALAVLGRRAGDRAQALLETWHPDDFVRGSMYGEGSTWVSVSTLLVLIGNAARAKEHTT